MKSLFTRKLDLSNPGVQLEALNEVLFKKQLPSFSEKLDANKRFPLKTNIKLDILQMNLGYMCNQVCTHCHVDAGPDRKEIMNKEIMHYCLDVIKNTSISTVDLTGGAPEMNPHFRWFVEEASKIGVTDFIVRSNLTIIMANKKYYDLPDFFKKHNVHIISSLPFYKREKTDNQRGKGVFNKSIEALLKLNSVGYGKEGSGLKLDLVYNPSGAFLPTNQVQIEKDFNISFNQLFSITNIPISRYLEYLIATGNLEDYMQNLIDAFNGNTVDHLMCKNTISVSWNGGLYDCDFNQMLDLKVNSKIQHIKEFNEDVLQGREINIAEHCYGCTVGAGSSCQGTII